MKFKNLLIAIIVLYSNSQSASAKCEFSKDNGLRDVSLGLPSNISVPRDTPNGTEIYQRTRVQTLWSNWRCSTEHQAGSLDARGEFSTSGIYPISDSGIGWQLILDRPEMQYPSGQIFAANSWNSIVSKNIGFRLIKIGDMKPGASIPSGTLGYYATDSLRIFSISTSGMKVVAASCTSPENINVNLGDTTVSDLIDGSYAHWANIPLSLKNCPTGINRVNLIFKTTSPTQTQDLTSGITALNPSSTAKGFGVQIADSKQTPIDLSKPYAVSEYSPEAVNVDFSLLAKLSILSGASELTGGSANAELIYTFEYL